jgi:steroid 5-alpha reductase family enzyme
MRKKLIGLIICMLLITLLLQSVSAAPTLGNKKEIFKDCYIEATGTVEPVSGNLFQYLMFKYFYIRPYGDERAFVLLWLIEWMEPDVTVTIYSEKDGDILWEDTGLTGVWGMRQFWYYGIYTNEGSTDDQLVVNLQGNAKVIIVYTEE